MGSCGWVMCRLEGKMILLQQHQRGHKQKPDSHINVTVMKQWLRQLMSQVGGAKTGSRLRWSIPL